MFKARYYKADGKKGKARALPDALFDGVVNEGVMHRVVKAHLLNQRQGTGSAKNRAAVRGGGRKPWRQKGTGRARQGTIRAPQWEGGGVVFPPMPKSWRSSVPKKVRSLARRSALNDRAENDRVVLADLPEMEAPKTRDLAAFLSAMELEGKTLILTAGQNRNLYLSSRNLEEVEVRPFGDESAYDLLWAATVVIELGALDEIEAEDESSAEEAEPEDEGSVEAAEAEEKAAAAAKPKKKAAKPKKKAAKPKKKAAKPKKKAAKPRKKAGKADESKTEKKATKKKSAKKKSAKKKAAKPRKKAAKADEASTEEDSDA